jgi:two-component system NtrC family sensor kinase
VSPLSNLVEAAQKIASGEEVKKLPIESENEIGRLTSSFNTMAEKITEARRDLENKIDELQKTQAQLVHSAKMVSLGQLVAGVAHELNNPIGYIYSNMTHLKEYSEKLVHLVQIAEKDPAKLEEEKKKVEFNYIVEDLPRLIKSCEDGALRTRDIVLGLRNFSRLDESSLKEVDIEEGINNTLQLLSGELKTRIKVHLDLSGLPKIKCYASQINQVFMNILTNAAQAIDVKGDIFISTKLSDQNAVITIKDNGPGIPANVLGKIFDPFFTTKSIGKGTGLGLSISYGIIKKHGGDILVKSEPGKGTEFTILLPLSGPLSENRSLPI